MPMGGNGIFISGSHNQVGGQKAGLGNLISGNLGYGIVLNGGSANVVEGNLVGVDASGTLKRGTSRAGSWSRTPWRTSSEEPPTPPAM